MEDGALDTQKPIRILLESALDAIVDERADIARESSTMGRHFFAGPFI